MCAHKSLEATSSHRLICRTVRILGTCASAAVRRCGARNTLCSRTTSASVSEKESGPSARRTAHIVVDSVAFGIISVRNGRIETQIDILMAHIRILIFPSKFHFITLKLATLILKKYLFATTLFHFKIFVSVLCLQKCRHYYEKYENKLVGVLCNLLRECQH